MNDDEIIEYFFSKNTINGSSPYVNFKRLHKRELLNDSLPIEIKEYLEKRYEDSKDLLETVVRIFYKVENLPACPICGKKLHIVNPSSKEKLFNKHCSYRCTQLDSNVRNKNVSTCLERYGVRNGGGSEIAKEKIKKTNIERYGVEYTWQAEHVKSHIRNKLIEKFGVSVPYKSEICKKKGEQTCLKKYGVKNGSKSKEVEEKTKKTNLERYGVEYAFQSEDVRQKIKNTCLRKYGVTSYFCLVRPTKESILKGIETKRKNSTFNSSKPELELLEMLKEKYQDVEYQYKDKRYPFLCDFYIPKFDLFIELNAFWTHGKHPFDENNKNDLERLNKLKSKSGKFYKLAIQVWTGENPNLASDPKKRLTAKENNLNFLELWDLDNNKNMKIIEDKIKKLNRNQETEL